MHIAQCAHTRTLTTLLLWMDKPIHDIHASNFTIGNINNLFCCFVWVSSFASLCTFFFHFHCIRIMRYVFYVRCGRILSSICASIDSFLSLSPIRNSFNSINFTLCAYIWVCVHLVNVTNRQSARTTMPKGWKTHNKSNSDREIVMCTRHKDKYTIWYHTHTHTQHTLERIKTTR